MDPRGCPPPHLLQQTFCWRGCPCGCPASHAASFPFLLKASEQIATASAICSLVSIFPYAVSTPAPTPSPADSSFFLTSARASAGFQCPAARKIVGMNNTIPPIHTHHQIAHAPPSC